MQKGRQNVTQRKRALVRQASGIVALPIAELVEDDAIYPRHVVDDANVARLVRALEAGHVLPPIVAEDVSKRIVDGWHRTRAYYRVLGPTGVADVDLRHYATEADLILDAIELNAGHGRQLDKMDQARCVLLAERAGIELVRIAAALHQPEQVVVKLRLRVADVSPGTPSAVPGTEQVVLKRPTLHLAGGHLSDNQAMALASAPGTSYRLLARQLTDAVRFNLANREDATLMADLRMLCDALLHYFESDAA